MLLAIYGLRDGEVCRLRVNDFDWEREILTVRSSKTHRMRTWPLNRSVGDAVLRYLKEVRPKSSYRETFLTLYPPFRPLNSTWPIVAPRMRSINPSLPHHGPHALRHACATRLLDRGLTLKEIGDHLGHQDPDTTRIYAKVDLVGLREVADFDLGGLL
jgi:integrase